MLLKKANSIKQKLFLVTKIPTVQYMQVLINAVVELKELWGCISNTKLSSWPVLRFCQRGIDCRRACEMSVCTSVKEAECLKCHTGREKREKRVMNLYYQRKTQQALLWRPFLDGNIKSDYFCREVVFVTLLAKTISLTWGQHKQTSWGEGLAETVIKSRSLNRVKNISFVAKPRSDASNHIFTTENWVWQIYKWIRKCHLNQQNGMVSLTAGPVAGRNLLRVACTYWEVILITGYLIISIFLVSRYYN